MISIIIPTYNRGYIIKKSIDSILKQSYTDFELIIVDDGSTDNTKEVVNSINDNRIKYITYEKNMGACYARNIGIKEAKGEFITFHDSDDYCYKDRIKYQYENMIKNKSDIDFCNFDSYCNNKFLRHNITFYLKHLIKKHGYYYAACYKNYIGTPALMVRNEVLKNNTFDERLSRLQDYDLILRLLSNYKVSHTDIVLLRQDVQENSITKDNTKGIESIDLMLEKYDNKLLKSTLYYMKGNMYSKDNKNKKRYYYKESLKLIFRIKVFIKLILNFL